MTTIEKKQKAIRENQLCLFHALQQTLSEISGEMLGTDKWDTDIVDQQLDELASEIKDHFGED
tara:strand:- start:147 stop:335 length:189 start_codon:yes stop_codon:yes gene_type:complete